MTQFEQAIEQVRQGTLKTPSVSMGNQSINYFGYQLSVHHFNLKIMASGMKFKGITFTQIKKYYGLKGKSAKDCLPQFEQIMNDYKQGVL
jgi:hypothetical protein